jgi:hypothetical protein
MEGNTIIARWMTSLPWKERIKINHSIIHSLTHSITQSFTHSLTQSLNHSINSINSLNQSPTQSITQSTQSTQSITQLLHQPLHQPLNQPLNQSSSTDFKAFSASPQYEKSHTETEQSGMCVWFTLRRHQHSSAPAFGLCSQGRTATAAAIFLSPHPLQYSTVLYIIHIPT